MFRIQAIAMMGMPWFTKERRAQVKDLITIAMVKSNPLKKEGVPEISTEME
jgi:hypothetical protein